MTASMTRGVDGRVDELVALTKQLKERIAALESKPKACACLSTLAGVNERLEALEGREVETDGITFTQEFLKEQQLPEEIDLAATAQRLGAEFNNLLNAMQDYPTEDEKSRFQEMTANKLD